MLGFEELLHCMIWKWPSARMRGLGPLEWHPLVMHYFSISSDASGVFKITSTKIIPRLIGFMETCKGKHNIIEEFLVYIA